ncbi:MAG: glycyl-radical enzyme activating protein [Chloroflexi bacterium]|nr:glycyl-radical enzyme activating protein [Chloroflexota bacterium]MBM4453724.1 glycyl-radical enzyme activating protein [Chloroflexota bacterium]
MKSNRIAISEQTVSTGGELLTSAGVNLTGLVLHLQRFSTEDGPGIRTTVFFKGCPMRCWWCHNPESISMAPQVQWLENRCIGCGTCIRTCPHGCIAKVENGVAIDRKLCTGCGLCADECPSNAMELLGKWVGVEEIINELVKDQAYFEKSGGGVTLSGGEPTMQPDFAAMVLRRLKERGINTAIDTCGVCSEASLDKLLPYTDIVLFDLKEAEARKHHEFTGQHNQKVFDNLLYIRDYIVEYLPEKVLWIRTPLIPGATAVPENIAALGAFIAGELDGIVQRWELCAFNNLCRDKYRRLEISWKYADTPLMSKDMVDELEQCAKRSGVDPKVVIATGATKVEDI